MSRTLLLCGHYPLPENTGANMRTMHFVRFFKERGSVDIAYSQVLPGAETGSSIFEDEYRLNVRSYGSYKTSVLHRLVTGIPSPVYEFDSESRDRLSEILRGKRYDQIVVRYLYSTASLLGAAADVVDRTILDFDDILSGDLYAGREDNRRGALVNAIFRWNRRRLKNYERECLRFGAALFCSEDDRRAVVDGAGEKTRTNTFVVPNVFSDSSFENHPFGDGWPNANTLLYVGTLSYEPNREALRWFIQSVFPAFASRYPDARLLVVGRFPDEATKELCGSRPDVELHSDVPDVKPYYERARAVVVPVLTGSGTRIKILEAAAAQRPVLSTAVGAAGLEAVPDRDILLFSGEKDFASQYARLLVREAYEAITRNAAELIRTKYSRPAFESSMEKAMSALHVRPTPGPRP